MTRFTDHVRPLLLLTLFAVSILATGCNGSASPPTGETVTGSDKQPDAKPADQPDGEVTLEIKSWKETEALIAAQSGKVVVVDLWSTSCVPCMREFPNLVALHNKYPAGKITCISVSCDYEGLDEEPPESKKTAVMRFLKSTKATCTNLLLSDADIDVYETIGLAAIPAVYVYDAGGKLIKRFDNDAGDYGDEGFTYEDHIVPLIESLITGEPAGVGNDLE